MSKTSCAPVATHDGPILAHVGIYMDGNVGGDARGTPLGQPRGIFALTLPGFCHHAHAVPRRHCLRIGPRLEERLRMLDFQFPVPRRGESHRAARAHFAIRHVRALVPTYVVADGRVGSIAAPRCRVYLPAR